MGELHQLSNGPITDKINFFNIINKNYPEVEATRMGLNTAAKGDYKEKHLEEKSKEVGVVKINSSRPDFSDLIGIRG